jgi:hypothetical protein
MSCCGNQRIKFHINRPNHTRFKRLDINSYTEVTARKSILCFEYIGKTGLTTIGGATGRRYRFDRHGSRVIVDPRDRPSLAAVPNLRQV